MTFQTIISNMGQWYAIDICYGFEGKKKIHTAIYDSLKKMISDIQDFNNGNVDRSLENF